MSVIDDRRGEEVLLSLIYPTMVEDMSTAQQTEFAAAAEEQLEYMMGGGNVQSEELGDARVTYCREGSIICGGERICPTSAARLMKCGLLNRWI